MVRRDTNVLKTLETSSSMEVTMAKKVKEEHQKMLGVRIEKDVVIKKFRPDCIAASPKS